MMDPALDPKTCDLEPETAHRIGSRIGKGRRHTIFPDLLVMGIGAVACVKIVSLLQDTCAGMKVELNRRLYFCPEIGETP